MGSDRSTLLSMCAAAIAVFGLVFAAVPAHADTERDGISETRRR